MEQAQQEMPQKYMAEIIRWFMKLKDANLTENDLVIDEVKEIVNNKLQVTYILKVSDVVIASYVFTDNRSLEVIKEQVEVQKTEIQANTNKLTAEADEIIGLVESKIRNKAEVVNK